MKTDLFVPGSSEARVPRVVDIWRSVLRRKWMVVAFVVPALVLAVLVVRATPPTYRATATLLIDQNTSRMVSFEQAYAGAIMNREHFMSQAEFLRSKDVARRTIRTMGFRAPEDFSAPGPLASVRTWITGLLPAALQSDAASDDGAASGEDPRADAVLVEFQRRLRVEPIRQSQLIEVSFDSNDRQMAARVANAVAQEYIQADLDAKFSMTQQASLWLTRKLAELRTKLEASEQELQAYRERQGLVHSASAQQSGPTRELEELTQRLVEARVRRTQVEQMYNQVRPNAPNRYEVQAVLSNPAVSRARQVESEAERTYADAAERYGPNFPAYKSAAAELALARANTRRQSDAVIAGIVKEYEAARSAEASLDRALASARSAVQEMNRKEINLGAYEREAATNRQVYQAFLDRVRQTSASGDAQAAPGRVIDPALAPPTPIAPRTVLILVATFGVSLLAGCLAALLATRLENTLNSADDVEQATGHVLLSAIPLTPQRDDPVIAHLVVEDPTSLYADSVRLALTGVQLCGIDLAKRVTAITSSIQGEGKSTVALSLALACARSRRTILIDADIRKPGLSAVPELAGTAPGLADHIVRSAPLATCIRTVEGSPLSYLPTGRLGPDSSLDLFNHPRFKRLLAELRESYDEIFIDCPPLNPVADGFVIGRHSDGVVLVVRAHSTPVPVVRATLSRLAAASVKTLGIVLNQYDARIAQSYYGDESGYGRYEYGGGAGTGGSDHGRREAPARSSHSPA